MVMKIERETPLFREPDAYETDWPRVRMWVRENYEIGTPINSDWPAAARQEAERMNEERVTL
jgi:hypothetical protein